MGGWFWLLAGGKRIFILHLSLAALLLGCVSVSWGNEHQIPIRLAQMNLFFRYIPPHSPNCHLVIPSKSIHTFTFSSSRYLSLTPCVKFFLFDTNRRAAAATNCFFFISNKQHTDYTKIHIIERRVCVEYIDDTTPKKMIITMRDCLRVTWARHKRWGSRKRCAAVALVKSRELKWLLLNFSFSLLLFLILKQRRLGGFFISRERKKRIMQFGTIEKNIN